jgi:S-adenosylhomocysteine hydrolase
MIEAIESVIELDLIVGIPYSSNRPGVAESWTKRFGDRVDVSPDLDQMQLRLVKQIGKSLALCRKHGQKLIIQEVGGFAVPLLHQYFKDQLHLVKGVVEITKQGVWRAEEIDLAIPLLHCADSELKRLEAKRCGESIARCLDGVTRELGLSLAGRSAAVIGAGWIGSGIATALRRLDMVPMLIDRDPLKVAEARLEGFRASFKPDWIEMCNLVVGATGRLSIDEELLARVPHNAIIASGSSRQLEIDVPYLKAHERTRITDCVEAYHLADPDSPGGAKNLLLVNDGFPANFIPGSASVPDEIVETILGELIVLMIALAEDEFEPGIHRITREQESLCAQLWIELRDEMLPMPTFHKRPQLAAGSTDVAVILPASGGGVR